MRRIASIAILSVLLLLGGVASARMSALGVGGQGASSAASCTEPAGDVYTEGFEGSGYELGACGSGQCWTETIGAGGSIDEDYALSSLTNGMDSTRNCTSGLNLVAAGAATYTYFHLTTGLAESWREFSFYLNSEGLGNTELSIIACISSDAGCSANTTSVKVKDASGTIQIQAAATGGGVSTLRNIEVGKWYYVRLHTFDVGNCTDVNTPYTGCAGSGTGNGTLSVGTTYGGTDIANNDTFAAPNTTANPDEFGFGVYVASRTLTITFGYDAVDDDGTF